MDLTRLQYFCVVAKTGSVRQAAKELKLSPSALSKAIRLLEEELKFPLVVQSGRGIRISDEGKIFAERSQSLLRDAQELREMVRVKVAEVKPVKLGSFETFSTYFLQALMTDDFKELPLVVHDLLPGSLEQALIDGRIDLGLTYQPIPNADIDHVKVGAIECGIYVVRGAFSGYKFSQLPFAVPAKPVYGAPTRVSGLDGWPDDKMLRNVRFQVSLLESAITLCEQGLAAIFIPKFVARIHNERVKPQLQLVEGPRPSGIVVPPQSVYLAKRKSYPEGDVSQHLARTVRNIGKG
jgi:DNA-binding transcriptional LysR family regulator